MKVAKQAVQYYCALTGNDWSEFFSRLDEALTVENPTGDLWLIKQLIGAVVKNGMSINEFKMNKDAVKGIFDEEDRKLKGEFFTPEVWCAEGRKYFDKHIPNWKEYTIWDGSCGSGNLLRTANLPDNSKLYLSSIQDSDVELIRNTPEYAGATAFQLDFLSKLDYDVANTEFLDQLPTDLQDVIRNDKPLIIYMNPPYKSGSVRGTDVGSFMCDTGLNKPAYDIFYQFCWRVFRFVEMFNLSNCYYSFFGPLTFFTGASAGILLREFEHCFEFVDGMCLSAQEFSDTSESILWGIGCSLWKSRGGYMPTQDHKDILLDKKYKLPDGTIGCDCKVLYTQPRIKLSEWVKPKDVLFYESAPLMTSHLTFKGSDVNVKVAPSSGKLAKNALGTLMIGNTLTRSADHSAVLSMPSTIQFTDITEENFWRCVSSFTFRRIVDAGWAITKKEISAPDTTVEGYEEWLMNALVLFMFEGKSMMSAIRDVVWSGGNYSFSNKLFYCTAEEIKANCTDEKILADLEKYPPQNQFFLEQVEKAKPYWVEETRQLYDFCKQYTLFSLNQRGTQDYKGSTDCWDAGFHQIRACVWSEDMETKFSKSLCIARDWLRKDINKFGFVSEAEDGDM